MSLLPYIYPYVPSRSFGYDSGLGLSPEDILSPHFLHEFFKPQHAIHNSLHQLTPGQNNEDPKKFHVCLDVHQFAPNEIVVKTIGRQVVVQGKHEEREDEHGYIMRHFVRRYDLPEGQEPNDVVSSISSDGFLTITAPRDPIILPDKNERIVPIMQTGSVHREVREHSVEHLPEGKKKRHHGHRKHQERIVPLAIKYF